LYEKTLFFIFLEMINPLKFFSFEKISIKVLAKKLNNLFFRSVILHPVGFPFRILRKMFEYLVMVNLLFD
jgi:hypothetical protein